MEKTMVRQLSPYSTGRSTGEQRFTCSPVVDPTPEQREAHIGADFLAECVTPMGDPCQTTQFMKDCILQKGLMLEQFVKNCRTREGLILENFLKKLLPCEDLTLEQGKNVRSPPPKEEEVAETTC
ncbi:hypothetical protein BTVI_09816 [Pitangus sulphuratus]|nr:hypothetical protein BTVI_09816 [Pitangus sulphuratus]